MERSSFLIDTTHSPRGLSRSAGSSLPNERMTTVRELMSPLASTISVTQSLGDAAAEIRGAGTAALVTSLAQRPMGLITESDLAEVVARHPLDWRKKRCASLMGDDPDSVTSDQPVEAVLARYRAEGEEPLLVVDGTDPVGILYPEAVLAWGADHESEGAARAPWPDFIDTTEGN